MLRSTTLLLLVTSLAQAQFRGGPDWTTAGGDAQRSSWVRTDPKISPAAMEKPGFQLAWKLPLKGDLGPAVLLDRYIGYRGFRSLAFVAGSGGQIVAIDTDLGRIEWRKQLASPSSGGCAEAGTAGLARTTNPEFPMEGAGRGGFGGRGGPARSAVGEPGEGAVTLTQVAMPRGGAAFGPPRGPGRGPGGFRRMPTMVYGVSSDGMLHSMYVSNGEEPAPPLPFLPAHAVARGLIVVDDVAYAAAAGECGTPSAVWALDLTSRQVATWKPDGGVAGFEGAAFGPDGTLYVATRRGDLAALEPKTLKLKNSYHSGSEFTSSPVVFQFQGRVLVAAASRDGRLHLLDGSTLAGSPSPTGVENAGPRALASWHDASGTPWLLAALPGSVAAWKVEQRNGAPALQQGWVRAVASPLPPMVINGVVFVAAGANSGRAALLAWDARTGKDLWNSGTVIASAVRSGGLSGGGSQLYLGTEDGTLYAFGFPIEH